MKRLLLMLMLFASMLVLPIFVAAQTDATKTVDLEDGYSIAVPNNWVVKQGQDGTFAITGEGLALEVTTPTRLHVMSINFAADSNITDVLVGLAVPFNGVQLQRSIVRKVRIDERQAATYFDRTNPSADLEYAAITLSDGQFGYLAFSAAKGELQPQQDVIDAVIASFDSSGTLVNTGSGGCTVSIDSANTAQLRVGPGPNRGAISFLPANVPVTVTGRIELDNGSIWYQLDKAEAAPNGTAAAELWVAAESITASGDCVHVGDTAAPPIIQSVAPPPTPQPNSGDSAPVDTSSAPVDTSAGGASGGAPSPGNWTLTLNATTNASCTGYQNVPLNSSELFEKLTYTYRLTGIDANSFRFGPDVYTRASGTNTFTGMLTFEDGYQGQAWLNVNSSTSINGQVIENFTIDDTACSGTILFLASHN